MMDKSPLEPTNIFEAISYAKHACTTENWLDIPDGARLMRIQADVEELRCLAKTDQDALEQVFVKTSKNLLNIIKPHRPHGPFDKREAINMLDKYARGNNYLHNCGRLLASFGRN